MAYAVDREPICFKADCLTVSLEAIDSLTVRR